MLLHVCIFPSPLNFHFQPLSSPQKWLSEVTLTTALSSPVGGFHLDCFPASPACSLRIMFSFPKSPFLLSVLCCSSSSTLPLIAVVICIWTHPIYCILIQTTSVTISVPLTLSPTALCWLSSIYLLKIKMLSNQIPDCFILCPQKIWKQIKETWF